MHANNWFVSSGSGTKEDGKLDAPLLRPNAQWSRHLASCPLASFLPWIAWHLFNDIAHVHIYLAQQLASPRHWRWRPPLLRHTTVHLICPRFMGLPALGSQIPSSPRESLRRIRQNANRNVSILFQIDVHAHRIRSQGAGYYICTTCTCSLSLRLVVCDCTSRTISWCFWGAIYRYTSGTICWATRQGVSGRMLFHFMSGASVLLAKNIFWQGVHHPNLYELQSRL